MNPGTARAPVSGGSPTNHTGPSICPAPTTDQHVSSPLQRHPPLPPSRRPTTNDLAPSASATSSPQADDVARTQTDDVACTQTDDVARIQTDNDAHTQAGDNACPRPAVENNSVVPQSENDTQSSIQSPMPQDSESTLVQPSLDVTDATPQDSEATPTEPPDTITLHANPQGIPQAAPSAVVPMDLVELDRSCIAHLPQSACNDYKTILHQEDWGVVWGNIVTLFATFELKHVCLFFSRFGYCIDELFFPG